MVYNIVYGIDNNYASPLATSIQSLLENNPTQRFHFYILALDISSHNQNLLQNWIKDRNQEISFVEIDYNIIRDFPIKQQDYISLASYLKIFISLFLPSTVSRALYVDADIIFNGPLSDLFATDISQYATAAVEDAPNDNPSRLGYNPKFSYFNAGFQLLNIDYLRKINFTEQALDYIEKNHDKIIFHDQDVMNALLCEHVFYLPVKWNMLDCYYVKPLQIADKYKNEIKIHKKDAPVIHFSGRLKPWHYGCRHPLKKLYKKYEKELPFKIRIDRWEGAKKYPPMMRIVVLFGYPWAFFIFINNLIKKIKQINPKR